MKNETEEWWIDYLEDEVSEEVRTDLDALLAVSETERKNLQELRELRQLVQRSDWSLDHWPDPNRLNRGIKKVVRSCTWEPKSKRNDSAT